MDPGGPTRIEILEPLMNTDTKSHVDIIKILHHLDSAYVEEMARREASGCTRSDGLFPAPSVQDLVSVNVSDGQSFKLEAHQLKRNPGTHRNRVPVDGPMHA